MAAEAAAPQKASPQQPQPQQSMGPKPSLQRLPSLPSLTQQDSQQSTSSLQALPALDRQASAAGAASTLAAAPVYEPLPTLPSRGSCNLADHLMPGLPQLPRQQQPVTVATPPQVQALGLQEQTHLLSQRGSQMLQAAEAALQSLASIGGNPFMAAAQPQQVYTPLPTPAAAAVSPQQQYVALPRVPTTPFAQQSFQRLPALPEVGDWVPELDMGMEAGMGVFFAPGGAYISACLCRLPCGLAIYAVCSALPAWRLSAIAQDCLLCTGLALRTDRDWRALDVLQHMADMTPLPPLAGAYHAAVEHLGAPLLPSDQLNNAVGCCSSTQAGTTPEGPTDSSNSCSDMGGSFLDDEAAFDQLFPSITPDGDDFAGSDFCMDGPLLGESSSMFNNTQHKEQQVGSRMGLTGATSLPISDDGRHLLHCVHCSRPLLWSSLNGWKPPQFNPLPSHLLQEPSSRRQLQSKLSVRNGNISKKQPRRHGPLPVSV